jgi:CubicO group peptidase (beta-lactamase class C family)
MSLEVQGKVLPGFEVVRDTFIKTFEDKPNMGASLAIRVEGKEVVNLYGGTADHIAISPWNEQTLSVIFSCSKGLMSILAAKAVQDGKLSYDDLVSKYWPEFSAAGKDKVTVGDLLAHKAGLSAPRVDISTSEAIDWTFVTNLLAAQEPLWEPGAGYAYHALTHGWLIGEVLRRVTGLSVGELFQRTIAGPLDAQAWFGLPLELDERVAKMHAGPTLLKLVADQAASRTPDVIDWSHRAMTLGTAFPSELVSYNSGFNTQEVHAAEIPGAGGISNASSLAAIWSATVAETEGVRLLTDESVRLATQVVSEGKPVWDVPGPWPRFGMGFQLDGEARRYLSDEGFGHDGAGGQVAFADPRHKVGFAFLTNQMEAIDDFRGTDIIKALSQALSS